MTLPMFGRVILTMDLPQDGLLAGDVGTVVDRHPVGGKEDGYSVEFFDMTGQTVAVITAAESCFRVPTEADRPAARQLTEAAPASRR